MPEQKMSPLDRHPAPWLPSFDLHAEEGELVLHAHLRGFDAADVEISLDGGDLVLQGAGGRGAAAGCGRLPLPFAPQSLHAASRPDHRDFEIRVWLPEGNPPETAA